MPACMHEHKSLARSTENVVGQPPSHTSTLASDLHFYRLIFSGKKKDCETRKGPGEVQDEPGTLCYSICLRSTHEIMGHSNKR